MLGNVSGKHRSPIRGSSLEFAEYRKYVPGDDTRRLDWRAWGRSDRFYIKEFEADTNLRLCFIVDTSGSMAMGADDDDGSKLDQAARIAGTLSFMASRQGDAVGLYCAADGFQKEIPPRRSSAHLKLILDELGAVEADGESGLAAALHEAAEKISQRALVVVISDFFTDPELLKDAFQHLRYRKHDVAVFHSLDSREIDFNFERPTRFLDLEGPTSMLVDPQIISKQYREAMTGYLEEIDQMVRDTGIDYRRVLRQERYENVLANFLLGRA